MIEQVHASDPAQWKELFARTAQGIGAEDRTRLEGYARLDRILRGEATSIRPDETCRSAVAEGVRTRRRQSP